MGHHGDDCDRTRSFVGYTAVHVGIRGTVDSHCICSPRKWRAANHKRKGPLRKAPRRSISNRSLAGREPGNPDDKETGRKEAGRSAEIGTTGIVAHHREGRFESHKTIPFGGSLRRRQGEFGILFKTSTLETNTVTTITAKINEFYHT